ncbi:MAG: alpha/beta hydrolase-fold protein [Vicinamibacterales bacterium]
MPRRAIVTLVFAVLAGSGLAALVARPAASQAGALRVEVSYPPAAGQAPLDGRLVLILSTRTDGEPRFHVSDGPAGQPAFGLDVENWSAGTPAVFDGATLGFPVERLSALPKGTYRVQALLHRYETFHRADGHTVKMPMDRGEGQQWNQAPGNLYSAPREVTIDPAAGGTIRVSLDQVIPEIAPVPDTKYVKHERIQSALLTKFWGRPMHIGASVLLPEGWDTHPNARYPLFIYHNHFAPTLTGWRETPPDANLEPDYSERFHLKGYNRIQQQYAYQLYKDWTGPNFPRAIVIEIQHATPFYDDSYAVNSANQGPYGDAIVQELIPYLEKKYRGLGQGWARFMYGGSTGGWEAMSAQVFYPDVFNGAYAACPDPIDFHAFTTIDIYGQKNAYWLDDTFKHTPRPAHRNYLGHVDSMVWEMNRMELVLGTKTRSGQQFDIWEAVFSPVGPDGYPARIFDKMTGAIDKTVAEYWREHYDLVHILRRDWDQGLGRKLEGKLNIYVGDMDNYYLNDAVYLAEQFLETTRNPYFGGEIAYGDRAEHCWNGDPTRENAYSRLRYHQMYIPKAVERMTKTAPPGADLRSWRY